MKQSDYKSYDELPLFLNADTVAKLLGISISSSYALMHEKGFRRCALAHGSSFRKKSSAHGSKKRREAAFEVYTISKA